MSERVATRAETIRGTSAHLRVPSALAATRSCVKIRLSADGIKYTNKSYGSRKVPNIAQFDHFFINILSAHRYKQNLFIE